MKNNIKQISISARITTTELNKNKVKKLIQELENLKAIETSDADVIKAATECL